MMREVLAQDCARIWEIVLIVVVVSGTTLQGAVADPLAATATPRQAEAARVEGPTWMPDRTTDESDGVWTELGKLTRHGHSAIYDATGRRMVVFGGQTDHLLNDVWALSLSGAPAWAAIAPVGAPPSARFCHTSIYDPIRECMVVFGGMVLVDHAFTAIGDVWTLSLKGRAVWTELYPAGTGPGPRVGATAIFDPARDRILLFGGSDDWGYHNDLWALSLAGAPTWTRLTPGGALPVARYLHKAIYDPTRDRMIVFGGTSVGEGLNDVWALSLSGAPSWTRLTPMGTAPTVRYSHSAIYDSVADRMVIFGGAYPPLDDLWTLSLGDEPAWTELSPSGATPVAREQHAAIYDPASEAMILFGGSPDIGVSPDPDAWTLSLGQTPAWTKLTTPAQLPSGTHTRSAIYQPSRDLMLTFGGQDQAGAYNADVWAFPFETQWPWTMLEPAGAPPGARGSESSVYDPIREQMVIFGGRSAFGPLLNDVWSLSLTGSPVWTAMTPAGAPPSGRSGHKAVYDPVRDRMLVFGGFGVDSTHVSRYFNDIWALSLSGPPTWTRVAAAGTPPVARGSTSVIHDPLRDQVLMFGGWDGSNLYNDVWLLSLSGTPTWTRAWPTGPPPSGRGGHGAIYDPVRDRMVVFGGSAGGYYNDVWALSLSGAPGWDLLAPSGVPPCGRWQHATIYDSQRDQLVIFGGQTFSDPLLNDVWALSLSGPPGTVAVPESPAPLMGVLRPPAPNPSHGLTRVNYSIARAGRVRIGVYDLGGRLVLQLVDGLRPAGTESVLWEGTSASGARCGTGVYFVRAVGPGLCMTQKLILLD